VSIPFAAYAGDEPYVFVCYAHDDSAAVYSEIGRLHDAGINVWYDEGISPGREWTQELADAIDGASHVLFFVSRASAASHNCRNEIQYASTRDKQIVAVHLEPTELPGGLELSIGLKQAILKHEMTDGDFHRKLTSALGLSARATDVPHLEMERRLPRWPWVLGAGGLIASVFALLWLTSDGQDPVQRPTIAVLPFENLSNDVGQEYFSDGIAEDILQGLARNPSLEVRARTSSFSFKRKLLDAADIAEQLHVRYLVNGSVRKVGNDVRVVTRLTDAERQVDIWNDRYDRTLADVFAVMDEITASVLDRLNVHFAAEPRRQRDPRAYAAYLQGRYHLNRLELRDAIVDLERAVDLDPSNADAFAALAQIWATSDYMGLANSEERTLSQRYVDKALALDEDHANARGLASSGLRAGAAIEELDRLIRQFPNDPEIYFYYSERLRQIGRTDVEIAVLEQRTIIDPLSPLAYQQLGYARQFSGDYDGALVEYKKAERLGLPVPLDLSLVWLAVGDLAALEVELARPLSDWRSSLWRDLMAAEAFRVRGDVGRMEQAIAEFEPSLSASRSLGPSNLVRSWIAMLRGDFERAVMYYRSALVHGEEAALDDIQGSRGMRARYPEFFADPGYAAMLDEFGLDPETISTITVPPLPFATPERH